MKRILLLVGILLICFLAYGCGSTQDDDKINLDTMNAGEILNVLTEQGYPMAKKIEYNDNENPEEYPWNYPGCTSAVEFWIPDGTDLGQSVGYIEVYSFIEASKERRDKAAAISSFYPAEPYYVQIDKVYLQVPQTLTEQEAAKYKAALEAMANGKLPEPYLTGALGNNYDENQAILIEEAKIIASMPGIFTNNAQIGNVEGIPVYKEELELIAARMKSLGKENPYKDAMERLKKYKHAEKMAMQYGITVSDEEISTYIDQQRDIFDNATDPEVTSFFKAYCAALKMTEEEYWTIFKPIEIKRPLLESKVKSFMESQGLTDISSDDIEYTINDATYLDKIEGEYVI